MNLTHTFVHSYKGAGDLRTSDLRTQISLCEDREQARKIVKTYPLLIKYAKERFQKDPEIFLEAAKLSPKVCTILHPSLKNDKAFVLIVLQQTLKFKDLTPLSIINIKFRQDREFVLQVLDKIAFLWKGSLNSRNDELDEPIEWLSEYFKEDEDFNIRVINKFFLIMPNVFDVDAYRLSIELIQIFRQYIHEWQEASYGFPILSKKLLDNGNIVDALYLKNPLIVTCVSKLGLLSLLYLRPTYTLELLTDCKSLRSHEYQGIIGDWQKAVYGKKFLECIEMKKLLSINFRFDTL